MISIDSEHVCILELLKASMFDLSPVFPKKVNWEKVFNVAKIQCIVPAVVSFVPPEHKPEWRDFSCRYKAYFMQMIYAQNSLVNLLSENNIPFVILKGTAASIYYPNPLLRTFGDIDFYVAEEHVENVISLLKNNGYFFISNDLRHYEFEKFGIDFELHYKFSCIHYNDIDHLVMNGLNHAVNYKICDSYFYGLPSYENGIVLLGHIMQHLKDSGIGLRQIIDWMMFVHKELDDSTWEKHFRPLAVEAGLEKLAITVTFMCKNWLGLSDEITWCNDANEEVADQLLIRILDDGNFGHDRAPVESIKKSMNKVGVFRHIQQTGIDNWPLAQKHRFFRPFAWIYQLFRYLFSGTFGLLSGKKIFMKDKHNMSLEELWKELE